METCVSFSYLKRILVLQSLITICRHTGSNYPNRIVTVVSGEYHSLQLISINKVHNITMLLQDNIFTSSSGQQEMQKPKHTKQEFYPASTLQVSTTFVPCSGQAVDSHTLGVSYNTRYE